MSARGTFAALAFASLFALPTLAPGAIVQKWKTSSNYALLSQVGDLNANGTYQLLTGEYVSGGVKIGIRDGATGALLAQTAAIYQADQFWLANLNADDDAEILFTDVITGKLTCVNYTVGQSTLPVRWSYQPTPNGVPTKWQFVDFDGNGHYYLVFKDESGLNKKYYVRDHNGVLVTTLDLTTAPSGSGWSSDLIVDDYDHDERQELMIDYHTTTPRQDVVYVIENNAPAPELATAPGARESHSSAQRLHVAPRKLERSQGSPFGDGNVELDMRATPRSVRLP